MSRGQKLVIFGWICFLLFQMAFPPFHSHGDGKDVFWGYSFLPSSMTPDDRWEPGRNSGRKSLTTIDARLLFVQMVGSTLVFLGLFVLLHRGNERVGSRGQEKHVHSGSGQSSKQSEEFFDVGDDGTP